MDFDAQTKPALDAQTQLEIVRRALVHTRNAQLIVGAAMFLFAALFATAFDSHATTAKQLTALGPAAFFGLVGALMLWVALVKNDPDRSPLLLALRDRPARAQRRERLL